MSLQYLNNPGRHHRGSENTHVIASRINSRYVCVKLDLKRFDVAILLMHNDDITGTASRVNAGELGSHRYLLP